MTARIGSLFSGYGGLEMGLQSVIGGEVAFHCEFDPAPSRILAHHWPDVPNLGDITKVDWSQVEHVDWLVGGFPCQDVSLAGLRRGLKGGTRSGLWSEFARAIDQLRPSWVLIENVRGLLSADGEPWHDDLVQMEKELLLAERVVAMTVANAEGNPSRRKEGRSAYVARWRRARVRAAGRRDWALARFKRERRLVRRAVDTVLRDLADLGYDAVWGGVRAADAGAPHRRFRVFILAYPSRDGFGGLAKGHDDDRPDARGQVADGRVTPHADDLGINGGGRHGDGGLDLRTAFADTVSGQHERRGEPRAVGGASSGDESASGQRQRVRDTSRDRCAASRRRSDRGGSALEDPDEPTSDQRRITASGEAEGGRSRSDSGGRDRAPVEWGPYRAAIERWETVIGRPAPAPTEPTGRDGAAQRLSPLLVEWMMGIPEGHVTGSGLSRAEQLKALGNGVVPQQAALALSVLLERAA